MACATLHQPEILFLDEPTSGVDPLTRREFWLLINSLASRGITVILTTHFLDEAEYTNRLVLLHRGRILHSGTPSEVVEAGRRLSEEVNSLEDAFVALLREKNVEKAICGTL
jgi:ABC-2 type transport system ATP-binding protein